jgi:hypothetical protein
MKAVRTLAVAVCLATGAAVAIHADVKTEQKGQVKFAGPLGTMFNMFGGKAAKEGMVTKIAVKGDRMMTRSGENGQLIDLQEEKLYEINFGNNSYRVTTFEELRRRMREAEERAKQERAKAEKRQDTGTEQAPEYEFDVATKSTGATKALNGFDTKQVITTITMRQKGKTLEQGGGMVLTADSWLAPKIDAMSEVADFSLRYMQKLGSPFGPAGSAEQMAAAFAMFPMLKDALGRMRTEGQKVDGTPILTTMTFDTVASAEQMKAQQENKQDDVSASPGGLGGLLARKMMKKKSDDSASGPSSAPPGHANVMTMVTETLNVSKDVGAADIDVPAEFKEKK